MTNGNSRSAFLAEIAMDGLAMENRPHSPTDSSEDSVEVKVEVIASRAKRKIAEPRRLNEGPLKKRIRSEEPSAPFRPWNRLSGAASPPAPATDSRPPHQYFRPPSPPPQPIDLIKRDEKPEDIRVPSHPSHTASSRQMDDAFTVSKVAFPPLDGASGATSSQRKEQRNYKNMTRERRIEANARERTRVHTISAAFDTLRRTVPAYSHSQKLSKLSVLRIACSYIMTLSNILDDSPDVAESVDYVSATIQREGKLRKKKE